MVEEKQRHNWVILKLRNKKNIFSFFVSPDKDDGGGGWQ